MSDQKEILLQKPDLEEAANFKRSQSSISTSIKDLDELRKDAEEADKAVINAAIRSRFHEYAELIIKSAEKDIDCCRATGGFRNG